MDVYRSPQFVVWDITYACPLRCIHCYSESGRRPSRQLGSYGLRRVTDVLISMKPKTVVLSGGEPLLVREVFEVAGRLDEAGIEVALYTSGWVLDQSMLTPVMSLFSSVSVSVDGATAQVHDRIRGRAGAFERAVSALARLDSTAGERRRRGERAASLGIDFVAMRSNFHQIREVCTGLAPRFPELRFVSFGAVVPSGLGASVSFTEHEGLSEAEASLLGSGHFREELQALAPSWVEVRTTDSRMFQMHPDLLAAGIGVPGMQVEPDGMVRAMASYEGTVGSLLTEPPEVLWERAIERWSDPFVIATLTPARTMREWAQATRRIDLFFGSDEVRARIARRPPGGG